MPDWRHRNKKTRPYRSVPITCTYSATTSGPGAPTSVSSHGVALNMDGLARGIVHVHDHRVQLDRSLGRLHADRQRREESFENHFLFYADYRVIWTRHAGVRLIGGAAGQDAGIGGGNVGVGADHGRDATVQIPTHGHLLAGEFRVKINEPHLDRVERRQNLIRLAKRAARRWHISPALQVDYG